MVMTVERLKSTKAFTLVEVMIATVIIVIAVMGTSALRYTTVLSARQADMQVTAARTALLLCESWRGVQGSNTYKPRDHSVPELTIKSKNNGPIVPSGFTKLGCYEIVVGGVYYYATLSWKDISPGLRALSVVAAWELSGSQSHGNWQADKSFELTTYVTY